MFISIDDKKPFPEQFAQIISEAHKVLEHRWADLSRKANAEWPRIAVIQELKELRNIGHPSEERYCKQSSYWGSSSAKPLEQVEKEYTALVELAHTVDKATHEANLPAMENNKALKAKLFSLMDQIGIPKSIKEVNYTKKGYFKGSEWVNAGWVNSFDSIAESDGWEHYQTLRADKLAQLSEWLMKQRAAKVEADRKAAEEEAKKRREREEVAGLVRLQVKYGVALEGTSDDVLKAILARCKYLRLAHAMLADRKDSYGGPICTNAALLNFTTETEEDRDIFKEVNFVVTTAWVPNGSCLGSCTYNYDWLFDNKVDKELLKDYRAVVAMMAPKEKY
jgi:hypothetical protein